MQHYYIPTKVKITTDLLQRLIAECPYEVKATQDGSSQRHVNSIFGIPIEIDDTINGEYEIIYEEN
jgi:hypothetical protein